MSVSYEYPRPEVAVDAVVFGFDDGGKLKILLIQRAIEPCVDMWALPGGIVREDESLDEAVRRELGEEGGLSKVFLEQLYTFGRVDRDPRGRVISVAYYALVKSGDYTPKARTDAKDARWFALDELPPLAFDHEEIVQVALERLKGKVRYQPLGFELLPKKFTLSQLQRLYEVVLGQSLDKRNFRKKILSMDLLVETGESDKVPGKTREQGRPAALYMFDERKYQQLKRRGFNFEI